GIYLMRALYSYGAALIIVLVLGVWLGSGTFVQGGNGPGKGEKSVISLINHKADTAAVAEKAVHEPTGGETVDPSLTIAQREAATQGSTAPVRAVEVTTFIAKAMPIDVPLRGQTKAKA